VLVDHRIDEGTSLKQAHYRVTDSMTRSISNASLKQTHCFDFYLLHVCSKTCSDC